MKAIETICEMSITFAYNRNRNKSWQFFWRERRRKAYGKKVTGHYYVKLNFNYESHIKHKHYFGIMKLVRACLMCIR